MDTSYEHSASTQGGLSVVNKRIKTTQSYVAKVPQDNQEQLAVPDLKHICITFVAQNMHLVESLVGFPDIVGLEIFKMVIKVGHLCEPTHPSTQTTMQLFSDAYKDQFLDELNVQPLMGPRLEECIQAIQTFTFLSKLDLRGSKLGDDHDLLQFVAQLPRLTHLGLADNALSDVGLQRMTSPLRILRQGPANLAILDLTNNPCVTDRGVKYLRCFTSLRLLDISATGISKVGVSKIEKDLLLWKVDANEMLLEFDAGSLCKTKGWAKEVVLAWATPKPKSMCAATSPAETASRNASNFYARKRQKLLLATILKIQGPKSRPPEKLRFRARSSNVAADQKQLKPGNASIFGDRLEDERNILGGASSSGLTASWQREKPSRRRTTQGVKDVLEIIHGNAEDKGQPYHSDQKLLEGSRELKQNTSCMTSQGQRRGAGFQGLVRNPALQTGDSSNSAATADTAKTGTGKSDLAG